MTKMNTGAELYEKAKKIIPGGNQLFSKRPEIFLPGRWPSYFKKAKGAEIWDLDNNKYLDMSIMGIGTCTLGYANPYVNSAVMKAIKHGSMCTLNSYEEVQLAEKLIELHPFAEMVRFSRTGGEACAIAVRIGRASSGKSKTAVCGYHGWHDWYLAANIGDSDNLKNLLLPGLSHVGLPPVLKGTALPFHYGRIDELESITKRNKDEVGVIIMEVQRGREPNLRFLKRVREIADEINAVLIFDEVSSGFRLSIGGVYKLYNVEPDILVLGKALGNGYPISAILGKRDVMEAAQDTFISSSYWTERIGFVAALETIKQFQEKNVVRHLVKIGQYIDSGLKNIFEQLKISIEMGGMITIPSFHIKEEDSLVIKTIFTQEMLKRGFLASNVIYLCFSHNIEIIDKYLISAYEVFEIIKAALEKGNLNKLLDGPVCHSGFKRLT